MKLGVIGTGKMGSALLRGILGKNTVHERDVYVYNHSQPNIDLLVADHPLINVCQSAREVAGHADTIIIAVKPYGILGLLTELANQMDDISRPLFISVAAGITVARMQEALGRQGRIVRTMPNTPSLIGEGVFVYTPGDRIGEADRELLPRLFSPFGLVEEVPEGRIDAISAVAGSGPAYMYVILDAMCEAAVALGMPRTQAKRFAIQTMIGSARLAAQDGTRHLMDLRDDVTSPGGSTIAALNVMDEAGLRHAMIAGIKAACAKTREMSAS